MFWPTGDTFQLTKVADGVTEQGYYYASKTDQVPLDRLIGGAVVVDVSAASPANADYEVAVADFTGWEPRTAPSSPTPSC